MRTTASFRATPFTGRDAGNGVGNGGAGMAGYGSGSGSYSYSPGQIGDGNGGTFSRNSDLSGYLDAWRQAANEQAQKRIDYAVNKGVNDLQRAEEDAKVQFQTQRNQVDADEARNLDNAALYAELRGDRGGIGQQQYSSVQNNAAQNRQTVNSEQVSSRPTRSARSRICGHRANFRRRTSCWRSRRVTSSSWYLWSSGRRSMTFRRRSSMNPSGSGKRNISCPWQI